MSHFQVQVRPVRMNADAFPLHLPDRKLGIGWPCPYCWETMDHHRRVPSSDHFIPKSKGGSNSPSNRLICCTRCNEDKSDLNPAEFLGWLIAWEDPRVHTVRLLLDMLSETWSEDERIAIYVVAGTFASAERARGRRLAWKPTPSALPERPLQQSIGIIKARVHNTLAAMGVPRHHWTVTPPDTVKVLLGPLPEHFVWRSETDLMRQIRNHPRASLIGWEQPC